MHAICACKMTTPDQPTSTDLQGQTRCTRKLNRIKRLSNSALDYLSSITIIPAVRRRPTANNKWISGQLQSRRGTINVLKREDLYLSILTVLTQGVTGKFSRARKSTTTNGQTATLTVRTRLIQLAISIVHSSSKYFLEKLCDAQ